MNENDKNIVYQAIQNHGDSFWNDEDGGNKILFDEILELLAQDGYDLKLVRHER